jgi:hypothetical protein
MKLTESMLRKMIQEERSKLNMKRKARISESSVLNYDLDLAADALKEALKNYVLATQRGDLVGGGDRAYAKGQTEIFVKEWLENH